MTDSELGFLAKRAMLNSYSPYSEFQVGAALLSKDGRVFTGCNIENSSFSPTMCAERTAFSKAISEGVTEFSSIAVVGGKNGVIESFCPPCGVCRQVMKEFCSDDFKIILVGKNDELQIKTLSELLPFSFKPEYLEEN